MKQMTAVEWFNQQLVDRQNGNGDSRSRDEIIDQAKAMEKEQIKDAWLNSLTKGDYCSAEEYYNETYKSE